MINHFKQNNKIDKIVLPNISGYDYVETKNIILLILKING